MVAPRVASAVKTAGSGALWGLKLLVIVLAVVEALYLLVANVALAAGWPKKWLDSPDRAQLEYDTAWTILPGWFHVRGFAYASFGSVPYLLEIPRGDVRLELGELLSRTLHVVRLRGDDAVLRVRTRVDPEDWDSPRARALPPIRGYTDQNALMRPPRPPPTDEDYDRWMIQLEDIDGTLRELWIQEYRYVGKLRVEGGFLIRPERLIAISPARVRILGGELRLAEHLVATDMEGDVDVVYGPFDPRFVERGALRHLSGRLRSSAQIASAEFANFYMGDHAPVTLHDGSGAVDWDLTVLQGILLAGSHFDLRTDRLDVRAKAITAVAKATLRLDAPAHGQLRAVVDTPLTQLYRPKIDRKPPSIEHATLETRLPGDLAAPMRPSSLDVEVERMKVPDLAWLHEPPDPGKDEKEQSKVPRFTGGAAELSGRAHVDGDGNATGNTRTVFDQAALSWYGVTLAGWGVANTEIDGIDRETKTVRARSRFEGRDIAIRHEDDLWPGWWTSAELDRMTLGGDPFGVAFHFRSKSRDGRPVVEILEAKGSLPGWVSKLLRHEGAVASGDFRARTDGLIDFALQGAKSSGVSAAGRARKVGKKTSGVFLIDAGLLSVGIEYNAAGVHLHPLANNDWLKGKLAGK